MSSPRTGCRRRVCVGACARARTCECAHLTYSSTPSLAPRSAQSGRWTVGSRGKRRVDSGQQPSQAHVGQCGSRPKPIAVRCSRVPVSLLRGSHPHPDPNPDPNPDINPDINPDPNPDINPDPNPHPNPDVDPHPTPCGPSNVLCLLTGTASRKARTCTMRTCTMHMYYAHVLCTWPLAKRAHVPCMLLRTWTCACAHGREQRAHVPSMLLRTWTCACAHGRAHVHVHVGMRMCMCMCPASKKLAPPPLAAHATH